MACKGCDEKPCVQKDCTCKVKIGTNCVTYEGSNMPCSGIKKGTNLTVLLEQLDAFICEKFNSIGAFFGITNTGNGAKIYSGDTNTGFKKLRTIISGSPVITVTEGVEEISLDIDEDELLSIIKADEKTYSASNVGTGAGVYKNSTTSGTNTNFNFKRLSSTNLSIVEGEDTITINTPETAMVPALYVNNSYVPTYAEFLAGNTKGMGTFAKPFTDTINYTSPTVYTRVPNTAIQNALDVYLGSGTRLNPEKSGNRIVIQENNAAPYIFNGDFNYSNIRVFIEAYVESTTQGYLINMDNPTYFNAVNDYAVINISPEKYLQISGLGLRNSGNNVQNNSYVTGRLLNLDNTGSLNSVYNGADVLTRYMLTSDPEGDVNGTLGAANDGNICIRVNTRVYAQNQGIAKVGGKSRIDFNGIVQSGTLVGSPINPNVKVIHQTGGTIRIFKGLVSFLSGGGANRDTAFYFAPANGFETSFVSRGTQFEGAATNWFVKGNTQSVNFNIVSSNSLYFSGTNLFSSPNLWLVNFRDNTFESIGINFNMVDLTQGNLISSVNTIGNQVIESLVKYPSRSAAQIALPPYSAFINTNSNPSPTNSDKWIRDMTFPTA